MKLSERVARRHLAKVLDKAWLMAVKRGWIALLEQLKVGSKERDEQTFGAMHTFLANLEEQIRFVHRTMFVTITHSDPTGRAFHEALKKLKEEITRVDELSAKIRKEAEFYSERYRKVWEKLLSEKGLSSYYDLFPKEELDHIVTQDHEDAVLIRLYPQLEESLKQNRYAYKVFDDWARSGFEVEKTKLNKRFDAVMKLLYDEARKLKELQGQGQEVEDEEVFTQFDLYGVKVVVDDRTVAPIQVKQYVKYFDKAYALLRSKHLEKVWYGTIFIKCEDCGGFNQNTQRWHDVGGNYPIGPDVVNIFSRPSSFIVELLVHELGHRYWFKFLSESQRGKFESLVRVKKDRKGLQPKTIPLETFQAAQKEVEAEINTARGLVHNFARARPTPAKSPYKIVSEHEAILSKETHRLTNKLVDLHHGFPWVPGAEFLDKWKECLAAQEELHGHLFNLGAFISQRGIDPEKARDMPWEQYKRLELELFTKARKEWVEIAEELLTKTLQLHLDWLKSVNSAALQKELEFLRQDAYEPGDARPVTPVSDYGKSNIDEAFAEAFMHYVVEMDMTQDQIESFKEVFKHASLTERVLDRFVALTV